MQECLKRKTLLKNKKSLFLFAVLFLLASAAVSFGDTKGVRAQLVSGELQVKSLARGVRLFRRNPGGNSPRITDISAKRTDGLPLPPMLMHPSSLLCKKYSALSMNK